MTVVGDPETGLLGIGQGKSSVLGKATDQSYASGSPLLLLDHMWDCLGFNLLVSIRLFGSVEEHGSGLQVPEPNRLGRW